MKYNKCILINIDINIQAIYRLQFGTFDIKIFFYFVSPNPPKEN